jgi:aspartate/methionine/tyrosine aminotransferase
VRFRFTIVWLSRYCYRYSERLGRPLNWETEVTVGVGSTECLFAIMQSLVEPGDEAVLISPAFDIYSAQVIMAGGKCVYVPLRVKGDAEGWGIDLAELRAAFNEKTKIVIINTPQNPTGKMMSLSELEGVAAILKDFPRVVAVSDEVYEHMTYSPADDALIGSESGSGSAAAAPSEEPRKHLRLASLPGMWERCLTVTSAGKTFSITGWKIGWVIGHAELVRGVILTNQWVQFSVSTPGQQAVATCLEEAEKPYEGFPTYFHWLRAQYARKRAMLADGLKAAGLTPIIPEGGFFIMADTSNVQVPESYMKEHSPACGAEMRRDWAFCRFLCKEIGVAAIPPSAFYEDKDKHLAANLARFAFCKEDASIEEACKRLQKLKPFLISEAKKE